MTDIDEALDVWSAVLGWCVVFGVAFLFIWAGSYFYGKEILLKQAAWFGLSAHEVDVIHYAGMGLLKALVMVFFLFPWISIRLVRRRRSSRR